MKMNKEGEHKSTFSGDEGIIQKKRKLNPTHSSKKSLDTEEDDDETVNPQDVKIADQGKALGQKQNTNDRY